MKSKWPGQVLQFFEWVTGSVVRGRKEALGLLLRLVLFGSLSSGGGDSGGIDRDQDANTSSNRIANRRVGSTHTHTNTHTDLETDRANNLQTPV